MLLSMWALASGRFLRHGVRPGHLSPEELVEFWADDFTASVGRHVTAAGRGSRLSMIWPGLSNEHPMQLRVCACFPRR